MTIYLPEIELLILSIKPRFAHMILRGEKTIELRRRSPRCLTEFWIALYATTPEKAMIGVVRGSEVLVTTPDDLWELVKGGCALEREEYRRYYEGTNRAVGIRLAEPISFSTPVKLDRLRYSWPEFKPPQSFAYLTSEQIQDVWDLAGMCFIRGTVG